MPHPLAIRQLKAVVRFEAIFVCTRLADGMRGVGLEVVEQVDLARLLDLGFGEFSYDTASFRVIWAVKTRPIVCDQTGM